MKNWKFLPVPFLLAVPMMAGAQSSVTLYGLVDVAVSVQNLGKGNVNSMQGGSYPSRLGVKGTEDLGGGLSATFQQEGDLNVDAGTGNATGGGFTFSRISLVGLKGSLGQLEMGRSYTPAFLGALNHDYSAYGFYNSLLTFTAIPGGITTRYSNGLFYTSPDLSGVTMRAAASLGERSTAPKTVGNAFGLSAVYKKDNFGLDAYYQVDQVGLPIGAATPLSAAGKVQAGLGGQYTVSGVRLLAGYGQVKTNGLSDKVTATNVGVVIPVGVGQILGQIMRINGSAATGAAPSAVAWGAAYRYFMSKRTSLYVTAGQTRNNATATYALFSTVPNVPSAAGISPRGFAVGIQHSF
ncbi:porin [Polaromonas sp. C04]|uniref:porin n=1 Tax=Polaromonas sp. C04 TaxID=1945857 RepID=UPI000984AE3E|nr:porin [Polaromonas sp. C04]OOG53113.1 hypothetical protein B0E49_11560 [Polaromonas sp. C04]